MKPGMRTVQLESAVSRAVRARPTATSASPPPIGTTMGSLEAYLAAMGAATNEAMVSGRNLRPAWNGA